MKKRGRLRIIILCLAPSGGKTVYGKKARTVRNVLLECKDESKKKRLKNTLCLVQSRTNKSNSYSKKVIDFSLSNSCKGYLAAVFAVVCRLRHYTRWPKKIDLKSADGCKIASTLS